ncbi:MAG: ferrous iron transporter B [Bacilli bacterium]|nr:ferrous iron transporter B [Bacilli bacterium]
MEEKETLSFALAGNPNCGKTTLFNSLTGSTAYVGNWPGVTVEKREGQYKKDPAHNINVVDLPGIYSLSPYSNEEIVSRDFLLQEGLDCIINVVDATNFERNLFFTTQLLELDVPIVVALNMTDVLKKNGEEIDVKALSKKLGVPVVLISALHMEGLDELMKAAVIESHKQRKGRSVCEKSDLESVIGEAYKVYKEEDSRHPLFHAIKALEEDEIEFKKHASKATKVISYKDFESRSAEIRYNYIKNELLPTKKIFKGEEKKKATFSDKIDKVLTHKWFAFPILVLVLFLVFELVFSEDLFFLGAFGVNFGEGYPGFISFGEGILEEAVVPFEGLIWTSGGINGIGIMLQTAVEGVCTIITEGIRMGLMSISSPEWVIGFLCDGVLAGVFAVIGFLPVIMCLFFFFSILEDSGYMARVAYALDRVFRKFGINGKIFLPMVMGLGCSVPAILNTKTLGSDKERLKTIRVIPFFTCSAKLPVITAVTGALAAAIGLNASLTVLGLYVFGMAAAVTAVIIMNKTTVREPITPFIMELPAYHRPQLRAVLAHVWDKAKHFIKKAFTIILFTSVLVWILSNFTWTFNFIPTSETYNLSDSIIVGIGRFMQPIFTPCGFGSQLGSNGYVFSVAALNGLIAKENVVGTLGSMGAVLSGGEVITEGADAMSAILANTNWTLGGMIGYVVFNLLTVPCMAAVGAAKGTISNKKSFWGTILFWLATSYIVSTAVYLMIDYVWTLTIIIPLFALALLGVGYYDKKKKKEEELQNAPN